MNVFNAPSEDTLTNIEPYIRRRSPTDGEIESLSSPGEIRKIYHKRDDTNDYNSNRIIQIMRGCRECLSANDTI